jgi:DNA-binding transcriptional ArsR family regulator
VTRKDPALSLAEIEAVFAALAHEARRHIVLLLGHTGGELPSGYLAKRFQHSWPTTTRHLNVLEKAGVVAVHRRGRSSYYRLERERVQRVLGGWLGKLDAPTPEATWTSSGPKTTRELAARTPVPVKPSRTRKG